MDSASAPYNNQTLRKSSWQRLLDFFRWLVILVYFPVVMVFVSRARASATCKAIKTDISNKDNVLIPEESLKDIILSEFPKVKGSLLKNINTDVIEKTVERLPAVKKCEVFYTMDGTTHVKVFQRHPIMRVFGSDGSYYMDEDGFKVTAKPGMHAHALVVTGSVNSMLDGHKGLISLCKFIDSDPFWRSMIEQVHVTTRHEFVLVPRVGDHIVEFGSLANMEQKFSNLFNLYKNGWHKDEWNVYSKVNLRFAGQVICTKRS